ncbi:MAG: DUF1844 domain-containing protein [Candidatus Omnitrophota bacterium]
MSDEKHVDESWKDAISNEKNSEGIIIGAGSSKPKEEGLIHNEDVPSHDESTELPEFNFMAYITSLAFQSMIFLGEIPNPMTNTIDKNLRQAKFIIDTLLILKEKTAGNLDDQENDALNGFIYELQMKFVQHAQKEGQEGQS